MQSYSIQIPDEKAATYKVVTFIIAILNLLAFGYSLFFSAAEAYKSNFKTGFIISVLAVLFYSIKHFTKFLQSFRVEILFILCAYHWFITHNILLGILLLIFAILGFINNKIKVIVFNLEGIHYPSFPKKIFLWPETDFVLLKDDILTIELKDNRLLQFTLDKTVANTIDTSAFNNFCAAQTSA